jgi:hypothetical protein
MSNIVSNMNESKINKFNGFIVNFIFKLLVTIIFEGGGI